MVDATFINRILEARRADFPGATEAERDVALQDAIKRVQNSFITPVEDKRLAAQLTSELSKIFVTISLAAVVALGTLLQLGWSTFIRENIYVSIFCFISGVCLFLSMYFGVRALADLANSGYNTTRPWDLAPRRPFFYLQALLGVAAIASFLMAVTLSIRSTPTSTGIVVTVPSAISAMLSGNIIVRGAWTQVSIEANGGNKLDLPPTSQGQTQSFSIRCAK
jgi:hypothetical protein